MDNSAWVGDVYRPKEQKAALLAFADAIGAKRKLGEDEAGNPRIDGKHGRIYVQPSTCDPGKTPRFQIFFTTGHAIGWRFAKEAMSRFAKIANNGEDEGILIMERLPSSQEGEVIRDKLEIFKKRYVSEETLARLRGHAFRPRSEAVGESAATQALADKSAPSLRGEE